MKRDESKEQFWRQAVAEARSREGTVREFCGERGLKESRFYFWQRKLKTQEASAAHNCGFVELVGPAEQGSASGVSIQVDDRCSIVLERGFDGQTLKAVVACLHADGGARMQGREGRQ